MSSNVVIREGRILLQEAAGDQRRLSLKICMGTNILKMQNLNWSSICNRWETTHEIKFVYLEGQPIELQLYYPSHSIPTVVGEAFIDSEVLTRHLEEELKIALTYDGMIKGWLYCQIGIEGRTSQEVASKFLYIHKISFFFLEDYEDEFEVRVFQNTKPIYEKTFFGCPKDKTLFPNIKQNIRYSDVIRITILNGKNHFKTIQFLVDNIKRGKTATYDSWIRNRFNTKAGDFKCEYFLQNLYLQNDRKVLSRKPIYPNTLERMSAFMTVASTGKKLCKAGSKPEEISSEQSTKITEERSCIGTPTSSGRSFRIIRQTILTPSYVKNKENIESCLKKVKTVLPRQSIKKTSKDSFYFENPFE